MTCLLWSLEGDADVPDRDVNADLEGLVGVRLDLATDDMAGGTMELLDGAGVADAHPAAISGLETGGLGLLEDRGGIDTGPIIAQVPVPVLDDDDVESLHERIKVSERAMLVEWVGRLVHEALEHQTNPEETS
jgi:hypothetical protein